MHFQVTIHTDLDQAFQDADVILLLDDFKTDEKNNSDKEKKERVREISERYRDYGHLIDTRANKQVKAIVSGDSFVNLRCALLADTARSIDSHQFVAPATQLENQARAIIAKKMKVRSSGIFFFYFSVFPLHLGTSTLHARFAFSSDADVTDVIVWGNISGTFYVDLQRAKIFNYDGAIKGPAFFSQAVLKIFHDRSVAKGKH